MACFDAVDQRRHHAFRPYRCFHPRPFAVASGFCTLCSPYGHYRCFLLPRSVFHASTFLPTFPRRGFAFRASRSSSPLQYYTGSDPCLALARQTGLFAYPALPSGHPVPTHVMLPNVAFSVTSARPVVLSPARGFTMNEQARHSIPPNRVRHPTGYPFASGCSPPRLAATQLPSATCVVTSHGVDSHCADKAYSRTHSSRRKPGPTRQRDGSRRMRVLGHRWVPAFAGITDFWTGNPNADESSQQ